MSGTLAVVSQTGQTLTFYDVFSGRKTAHIDSLTAEPHEICYDSKRNLLYVSHAYRFGHYWRHGENAHEISVIDVSTKQVVTIIDTRTAKAPHGMYIHAPSDTLFVSVEELPEKEGGGVIGIDLASRKVVKQVPSESKSHWFIMTPDAKKAYTCNKDANFVSILDLENQRMTGRIDFPGGSEEPSMSTDGNFAYFPTPGLQLGKDPQNPVIQVIDTKTDQIVRSIKMNNGASSLLVSPKGSILAGEYTYENKDVSQATDLHALSGTLGIYDPVKAESAGAVKVGVLPLTLRSSSDGKTAFVANVRDGTVSVVDLESRSVVRTIGNDDKPRKDKPIHVGAHGMAYISHSTH